MYCLHCYNLAGHYKGCYSLTRRARIIRLLRRYIQALLATTPPVTLCVRCGGKGGHWQNTWYEHENSTWLECSHCEGAGAWTSEDTT